MKRYIVNHGHRLRMPDGSIVEAGGVVEFDEALAQLHAERLTEQAPDRAEPSKAQAVEPKSERQGKGG